MLYIVLHYSPHISGIYHPPDSFCNRYISEYYWHRRAWDSEININMPLAVVRTQLHPIHPHMPHLMLAPRRSLPFSREVGNTGQGQTQWKKDFWIDRRLDVNRAFCIPFFIFTDRQSCGYTVTIIAITGDGKIRSRTYALMTPSITVPGRTQYANKPRCSVDGTL